MLLRSPLNSVQQLQHPECKQVDLHHMSAGPSSLPASKLAPHKRSLDNFMGGGAQLGFANSIYTTSIGFGNSSTGLRFGESPSSNAWLLLSLA